MPEESIIATICAEARLQGTRSFERKIRGKQHVRKEFCGRICEKETLRHLCVRKKSLAAPEHSEYMYIDAILRGRSALWHQYVREN